MNKKEASQIIQAYQDYRHWDDYSLYPIPELDELNDALDLAVKELWKPDGEIPKTQEIVLDLYKDASRILATTFFRYIYEDESIETSDIHFVADGTSVAELWDRYFSIDDMYDILRYKYEPKFVNDWYDYSMVSEDAVSLLFFKHLVAVHGYTTPEQLLADHKKEREENEKRINTPEYKAKEEAFIKTMNEKFISENF